MRIKERSIYISQWLATHKPGVANKDIYFSESLDGRVEKMLAPPAIVDASALTATASPFYFAFISFTSSSAGLGSVTSGQGQIGPRSSVDHEADIQFTTMLAPSSDNLQTIAAPMLREDPVTIATLPMTLIEEEGEMVCVRKPFD